MKKGRPKYHRRSIRLKGYDYSNPGFYFITICTKNKEKFFGEIINTQLNLSVGGKVALDCWNAIPNHYPNVKLHPFIIMPNHIHGIIEIISDIDPQPSDLTESDNPQMGISIEKNTEVGFPGGESLPFDLHDRESKSDDTSVKIGLIFPDSLKQDAQHMDSLSLSFGMTKANSGKHRNEYQHIIPKSIGSIVRGFEIGVTKWFRENTDIHTVWQRNFHDTIIRSERDFRIISNYIINNPKNWDKDEFHK